jgi:uncharacterized protein (TIGR03437 family)
MKRLALAFIFAAIPLSATVSLGLSNQNFTLTGLGANSSGEGQATVGFGSCTYNGVTTTCTVSGPFTGLGAGGTYTFAIAYAGNGAFPLQALVQTPSTNQFVYQAVSNYSSFVITLAETNGPTINFYSFANFSFVYSGATCTGVSSTNCSVGQVSLTPGATIVGPVTGTFNPAPSITPNGANSAANYGSYTSITPSTWMEIYGVNLANVQATNWENSFNGNLAPTSLGGTTVTVAGIPAYIDYVSPGQVNIQVPSGVPDGPQPIVVTTAGGTSTAYTITVNSVEPGLLAPLSFFVNGSQYVVALISNTNTYVLPETLAGVSTTRAAPGEYITLYGIGFGPVTPNIPAGQLVTESNEISATLQITFAGVPATVSYAGLGPGYLGLYQFNVMVPNVAASDTVPVAFTLGGVPVGQQNLVIAIN